MAKKTVEKKESSKKASYKKAALIAAALRKEYGNDFCDNIVKDPNAPAKTAHHGFVNMPEPVPFLTGVMGIPYGHISVIQGKPDCGKTTLAMFAMVQAQKDGQYVVLLDTEYKFSWDRFESMGGDSEDVIHVEGRSIEEAFDKFDKTMEKILSTDPDAKILFVWDSLGMTPTEAELENKKEMGTAARVIKRGLRVRMSKLHKKPVALLLVNHVYARMDVMFGEATKGYGGEGAYFAAVIVLEVKRAGQNKTAVKFGVAERKALSIQIAVRKNHIGSVQGRKVNVLIFGDKIELLKNVENAITKSAKANNDSTDYDEIPDDDDLGDFDDTEMDAMEA